MLLSIFLFIAMFQELTCTGCLSGCCNKLFTRCLSGCCSNNKDNKNNDTGTFSSIAVSNPLLPVQMRIPEPKPEQFLMEQILAKLDRLDSQWNETLRQNQLLKQSITDTINVQRRLNMRNQRNMGSDISFADTNDFLENVEIYRHQQRYGWDTFIFKKFNLHSTDIKVRRSMLISINLHYSTLTAPQIGDFLDVIQKHEMISASSYLSNNYGTICTYYQTIRLFFKEIPMLYQNNDINAIYSRIQQIFDVFIPKFFEYFAHYFKMYSDGKIVIKNGNKQNLKLNGDYKPYLISTPKAAKSTAAEHGDSSSRSSMGSLLSQQLDRYNSHVQGNDQWYNIPEKEEVLFHNDKIKDLEAMSHNVFATLVGWVASLGCVTDTVQNEDNIKIKYSKFPLDEIMLNNHLSQQINSVFPDIQYSMTSSFYYHQRLSHHDVYTENYWNIPVQFVRLMAIKILLYSRRNAWGSKELLRLHWNAEHVIKYNPLQIVLRISQKDNILPLMQLNDLEKLQVKINNDYTKLTERLRAQTKKSGVENFEDNKKHEEKWLNNVFLLTSIVMSELDGTFGVINHYKGSGKMEAASHLLLPKKEFFIEIPLLTQNEITQQDIDEMIETGKVKKGINGSKTATATDWGELYQVWMDIVARELTNVI